MKKGNLKGSIILCITALIWGLAFVAQSDAGDVIPTFTFTAIRSIIGAVFLLILGFFVKFGDKEGFIPKEPKKRKDTLVGGVICGVLFAVASNLQQFGIIGYPDDVAEAARAGFITALYVIIVPILSIVVGKKIGITTGISALIAICGIYLLCFTGGFGGVYVADVVLLSCSLMFSIHMMCIDKYVGLVGSIRLSSIQFIVSGILSTIFALIFETVNLADILSVAPQILYVGILSSGVAYTLQMVGQKYAEPAVAGLTLSLESVFATIGGWLISGDTLTAIELCGCGLVFVAIITVQLPDMVGRKRDN